MVEHAQVEGQARPGSAAGSGLSVEARRAMTQARALIRLAAPLVVSRAGLALMGFVDAVMIAQYDSRQLATIALAEGTFGRCVDVSIAFILSSLVLFPSTGEQGGRPAQQALWRRVASVALGLGVVIAVMSLGVEPVLRLLGQSEALSNDTTLVVHVLALGLPAGLVAMASAVFLEGTRRAGLVAIVIVIANILNLGLNWVLIGGHAGLPAMGVVGAVASTSLVRVLLAAVLLGIVSWTEGASALAGRRLDRDISRRQWRLGGAAAGTAGGMHALAAIMTVTAGWLGPVALAAYASCWIINLPGMLMALGMGDAVALRAARTKGGSLARDLCVTGAVLAPVSVLIVFGSPWIARLYAADPVVGPLIATLLPLSGVVLFLDGMSYAVVTSLRGLGDVRWCTLVQLSTMTVTPLLAGIFALNIHMEVYGMIVAIVLTSSVQCGLLLARVRAATPQRPGREN